MSGKRTMGRRMLAASAVALSLGSVFQAAGQTEKKSPRIDVQHYAIDAEVNPRTQSLTAKVEVQFTAVDDAVTSANFELNNALNLSRVVDGAGQQIPASRNQQDFSVRLNFPTPIAKGAQSSLTFTYDGRLTGQEDSPVFGIKFAALNPDVGYLMYPARWFPVNDYTTDRFAADLRITVPSGYRVVASGQERSDRAGDKVRYAFSFTRPSFPGSIAIVQGEPVRITSGGVTTTFYLRETKAAAQAYADEIGKVMTYFTSTFGLPLQSGLTVVETESGTPNGYAAPGILFLAPKAIGKTPNTKLLANQI